MLKGNIRIPYFDRIPQYHVDITIDNITFVICENPVNQKIPEFLQLFDVFNVKNLILIAFKNYDTWQFSQQGVTVTDMWFSPDELPDDKIVE